jgi:ubiquinone/menaquinone biosynthesis C-methylase UbiE
VRESGTWLTFARMPPRASLLPLLLAACGANTQQTDHAAGHPHAHGHHHGGAPEHHHDFSDVERFQRMFDDPARDEWQRPDEVVTLLEAAEGMTIADIGAGTGYFLGRLSAVAGESGRVLALDTEPNMVAHMQRRIEEEALSNAEARVAEQGDPGLEPSSVDRILIVDTWHHIADRERYAARLRDALRPGGSVLVVDFTADSPRGPPPAMRLSPDTVARELEAGGLQTTLLEESLPYQFVVRATRPPS